jgi:GH18 family chitinase
MWVFPSPRRLAVLVTLLATALPTLALVVERGTAGPISIGFFDSWGYSRPCSNLTALQVDTSKYTHLVWTFVNVTDDHTLTLGDEDQWKDFLSLPKVKKILGIGGWLATNRVTDAITADMDGFVDKIVDLVNQNKGIDGVDIDWEYPSATQANTLYVNLVRKLRSKLPPSKSISIDLSGGDITKAWNLKDMAGSVDWFIVMSYDYVSWGDYGKHVFASINGCPNDNCLRSHVNATLAKDIYSWITGKDGGVPGNKVVMGLASYANGYRMTNAACSNPADSSCTYLDESAISGRCLSDHSQLTLGEIKGIVKANKPGTSTMYNAASDSNILVLNNTDGNPEWYGYMDEKTMEGRRKTYASWGALGSAEWTVTMG